MEELSRLSILYLKTRQETRQITSALEIINTNLIVCSMAQKTVKKVQYIERHTTI